MLKPILTLAISSSLLFSSCGAKKEENKKEEEKKEETSEIKTSIDKTVAPNSLADISISGMICEVNCVGSVKELLSAMVGVAEIEIDFNPENSINHAMVKYDNSKVNDQQMVTAIEKLNDGIYKVETIEVKKLDEKTATKKKIEEDAISVMPKSSGSAGFALPNILDVFSNVL